LFALLDYDGNDTLTVHSPSSFENPTYAYESFVRFAGGDKNALHPRG